MRYNLSFNYITCYFENGIYGDGFGNCISSAEKKFLLNYLYLLNKRMYSCESNDKMCSYLSNNVCFYKTNQHYVLFKTISRSVDNKIINELEGLVIESTRDDVVWMYMENLLGFILSDLFYDCQTETILTEELLMKAYDEKYQLCKKDNYLKPLFNDIKETEFMFPFCYSNIEYETNQFRFYKSSSYDYMRGHSVATNVDEIIEACENGASTANTWVIELQSPSRSNLPAKQGFFKDRKAVKELQSQGVKICVAHRKNDKKNVVEIPDVTEGEFISFQEINQKYFQNLR